MEKISKQLKGSRKIPNPDEILEKISKLFTKNRKIAFLTVIILGAIAYVRIYCNGIGNADSLVVGYTRGFNIVEVQLGRWALGIISLLRGNLVSPIITTFIAIILTGITAIILNEIFEINKPTSIILIASILVLNPAFANILTYHYCSDSYALAMLLAVLSVYLIYKRRTIISSIMAIICVSLSMGLYQPYIGVIVSLCMIIAIKNLIASKKSLGEISKETLKAIIIFIIGVIIYYIIAQIFFTAFNTSLSSYRGANKIGLGIVTNLGMAIKETYRIFYNFLFSNYTGLLQNTYYRRQYLNIICIAIILIVYLITILKNRKNIKASKIIASIILLGTLPIGINIIKLIAQETEIGTRMSSSLYLIYVLMIIMVDKFETGIKGNLIKWLTSISMIAIIITWMLSIQSTYTAIEYSYNETYSTMLRVVDRIEQTEGYKENMKYCFVGTSDDIAKYKASFIYSTTTEDFISKNVFWGNDKTGVSKFLRQYLGKHIEWCSNDEYSKIINSKEFKEMSVFPNSSAVKVIDNIIVVKFTRKYD